MMKVRRLQHVCQAAQDDDDEDGEEVMMVMMRRCGYVLKLLFCLVGRMIRSIVKVTDRAH